MSDLIEMDLLQPGDVLLCQHNGIMGRLIQLFDGSSFSHAALYVGDGQLGEATSHGVKTADVAEKAKIYEKVDAFRLIDAPGDMDPVVKAAHVYLNKGERYGYEQIVLCGFLSISRKVKINPFLNAIIRRVLDSAASLLLTFTHQKREPMICSELVYRSYDEAVPGADDPFSLTIAPPVPAPPRALSTSSAAPAAAPQGLGQGVHPHSLLAFMASDVNNVWLPPAPPQAPRPAAQLPTGAVAASAAPAIDEAKLEELFESYLKEVRTPTPPAALPSASTSTATAAEEDTSIAELRGAVQNFAASFAKARAAATPPPSTAGAPAMALPTSAASSFDSLFSTVADFVSPADLEKCRNLFRLGKLAV